MLPHSTHDIVRITEDSWESRSHNLPDIVGRGATEQEAWDDMNRKLIWYADNYPEQARQNLQYRLDHNLLCMCGVALEETPIAVYRGGNKVLGLSLDAN